MPVAENVFMRVHERGLIIEMHSGGALRTMQLHR